jgi:hypothetical protein
VGAAAVGVVAEFLRGLLVKLGEVAGPHKVCYADSQEHCSGDDEEYLSFCTKNHMPSYVGG